MELTKEQSELLNAKLIIADLTLEIYKLRAELFKRSVVDQEKKS